MSFGSAMEQSHLSAAFHVAIGGGRIIVSQKLT